MKMRKVIFVLLSVMFCVTATGQGVSYSGFDVVYLKNGSVLKGRIVEMVPSRSVTIATPDGSVVYCDLADVSRFARESKQGGRMGKQEKRQVKKCLQTWVRYNNGNVNTLPDVYVMKGQEPENSSYRPPVVHNGQSAAGQPAGTEKSDGEQQSVRPVQPSRPVQTTPSKQYGLIRHPGLQTSSKSGSSGRTGSKTVSKQPAASSAPKSYGYMVRQDRTTASKPSTPSLESNAATVRPPERTTQGRTEESDRYEVTPYRSPVPYGEYRPSQHTGTAGKSKQTKKTAPTKSYDTRKSATTSSQRPSVQYGQTQRPQTTVVKRDTDKPKPANTSGGYEGRADISYGRSVMGNTFNVAAVNLTNGYRFNPYFYLGAGVGIRSYHYQQNIIYSPTYGDFKFVNEFVVPVFATVSVDFTKTRLVPFLSVNAGYGIPLGGDEMGGVTVAPSLGVAYRLKKKVKLSLSAVYMLDRCNLNDGMLDPELYRTGFSGSVSVRFGVRF